MVKTLESKKDTRQLEGLSAELIYEHEVRE